MHMCSSVDVHSSCLCECVLAAVCLEQSRVHKTDHSVTAHFPAHYRQQVLMGAYNEGPCLGQVMGEYSPNSYASIFRSISPSDPSFSQTFPLLPVLYATVHPQRHVILSVYLFPLSVMLPLPSSTAPHLPPLSPLPSPGPRHLVCLLLSWLTANFLSFWLRHQHDWPNLCFLFPLFLPLFFPFAPPGNNLKQRRPQDAGWGTYTHAHTHPL